MVLNLGVLEGEVLLLQINAIFFELCRHKLRVLELLYATKNKMIHSPTPVTNNIDSFLLLLFPPLLNQNLSEMHHLDN